MVIIMTSNAGGELIKRQTAIGFGAIADHGLYEALSCSNRVRFAFPIENVAASRTHLTHRRPAKHVVKNTCTGPFVPFTIISEYFTDLIV